MKRLIMVGGLVSTLALAAGVWALDDWNAVTISDSVVSFGVVNAGETDSLTLTLTNNLPVPVTVTGAAFGAEDYNKMRMAYMYALKAGVLVEGFLALLTLIFATQITWIFTWSVATAGIIDDLILFLRVIIPIIFGVMTIKTSSYWQLT